MKITSHINNWVRKSKLNFNAGKSWMLLISNFNKKINDYQFLEGQKVPIKKAGKWLGKKIRTKNIFDKREEKNIVAKISRAEYIFRVILNNKINPLLAIYILDVKVRSV